MKELHIDVNQKSNNSKIPKDLSSLPQASGEQLQSKFFVDINGKPYFITLEQLISIANSGVVIGIKGSAEIDYRTGQVIITKDNIGLGNVTNDAQVKRSEMGVENGVATLNGSGKIPENQLPSYVDDVVEYSNKSSFPTEGESGKIYIALDTNLSYRWSGTTYVEMSSSLTLGETEYTAYAGSKGKKNAEDIQELQKNSQEDRIILNNVNEWFNKTGTDITNWIEGIGEDVEGFGEAIQKVNQAVEDKADEAREAAEESKTKLNNFFTGVIDVATDIGEGAVVIGQKIGGLFGRTNKVEEKTDELSNYITLANQNVPMITYEMNDTIESENTTFEFNFTSNGVQFNKMVFNNNTSGVFTISYYKADGSFESVYSSLKTGGWFDTAYKFIIASNIPTGFLNYAKISGDVWVLDNTFGTNTLAFDGKISFVVGNTPYKEMDVQIHQETIDANWNTYYYTSINYVRSDEVVVNAYYTKDGVGGWQSEEYRTIVVLNATNEDKDNLNKIGSMAQEELETDAKTLAGAVNEVNRRAKRLESKIEEGGGGSADLSTYQTKTDETLETESKEVVGAINEVNSKTVDKVKSIDTWAIGVSDFDVNSADGISWKDGFILYNELENNGETISNGNIYHRVPIVAGENVTFEVDEENQVVKINATGGGSTTDDSAVGTWVFKDEVSIPEEYINREVSVSFTVNDWNNEVSLMSVMFFYTEGGYFVINYDGEKALDEVYYGSWTHENFKTITILEEPTDAEFISWLKANAVKQKETPKEEMPQIRFVGMPCDGWFGYVQDGIGGQGTGGYTNLKFTIEIVGGGTLQIGDTIQICRMGTYGASRSQNTLTEHPRKRKLRKLFEYTIAEGELDNRFITIDVDCLDKKAIKLFTKWATGGINDKTIYFRIRRPKGDMQNNDTGMTVDAEFSNVVSVRCLSYPFSWFPDGDDGDEVRFYHIRIT